MESSLVLNFYGWLVYINLQIVDDNNIQKNLEELSEERKIVEKTLQDSKIASNRGTRLTGINLFPLPDNVIPALKENGMYTEVNKEIFSKWHLFSSWYTMDDMLCFGIGNLKKYYDTLALRGMLLPDTQC